MRLNRKQIVNGCVLGQSVATGRIGAHSLFAPPHSRFMRLLLGVQPFEHGLSSVENGFAKWGIWWPRLGCCPSDKCSWAHSQRLRELISPHEALENRGLVRLFLSGWF